MTDTNAQEPTMEEILASIRRIISEDDAPASSASATPPGAVEAAPAPSPPPAPEPEIEAAEPEDDVLELTEPADPAPPVAASPPPEPEPSPASESVGDLDVFATGAEPPPRAPPPPRAAAAATPEDPLVTGRTAESAAAHFGQLAQSVIMPREGRTLEDVVRELLRPLLKDWLDQNLPGIVEARVQAEVERIARGRF